MTSHFINTPKSRVALAVAITRAEAVAEEAADAAAQGDYETAFVLLWNLAFNGLQELEEFRQP